MAAKKRFIAGAMCPSCQARDTVMMYRDGDYDYRECVDCGFRDRMHFKPATREPVTRVNQSTEKRQSDTQVISISPLKKD